MTRVAWLDNSSLVSTGQDANTKARRRIRRFFPEGGGESSLPHPPVSTLGPGFGVIQITVPYGTKRQLAGYSWQTDEEIWRVVKGFFIAVVPFASSSLKAVLNNAFDAIYENSTSNSKNILLTLFLLGVEHQLAQLDAKPNPWLIPRCWSAPLFYSSSLSGYRLRLALRTSTLQLVLFLYLVYLDVDARKQSQFYFLACKDLS